MAEDVDIGPFKVNEDDMFRVRPRETALLRAFVLDRWQAAAIRQYIPAAREGWVMVEAHANNFSVMEPLGFELVYERVEMNANGGPV